MSHVLHVFDLLERDADWRPSPITVLAGSDSFLRKLAESAVIAALFGDQDIPYETFDGKTAEWRDLADELATVSLFAPQGPRLAIVTEADKFVTAYRGQLEKYAEKPSSGVLVLEVDTFPATTRLYKVVTAKHTLVHCKPPERPVGKTAALDTKRAEKWLCARAAQTHRMTLMPAAAELLLELVGPEFGLLDQELAKLSVCALGEGKITPELVREHVGGWRLKTGWDMIDAALDGDAPAALEQLGRLLMAGESPNAIFAQMSWALRQFAAATRAVQRAERAGKRISVRDALTAAGVRPFPPGRLEKAERQLRQIGRARGAQIYRWLLEADLALKGSHSSESRSRWMLEQLVLRLAKTAPVAPTPT